MEVGQKMNWHKVVSNYGHVHAIPGTALKIGKRITVEAPLKNERRDQAHIGDAGTAARNRARCALKPIR